MLSFKVPQAHMQTHMQTHKQIHSTPKDKQLQQNKMRPLFGLSNPMKILAHPQVSEPFLIFLSSFLVV